MSFFSSKYAFRKKLCSFVINDFVNTSELNWELRIKGGYGQKVQSCTLT